MATQKRLVVFLCAGNCRLELSYLVTYIYDNTEEFIVCLIDQIYNDDMMAEITGRFLHHFENVQMLFFKSFKEASEYNGEYKDELENPQFLMAYNWQVSCQPESNDMENLYKQKYDTANALQVLGNLWLDTHYAMWVESEGRVKLYKSTTGKELTNIGRRILEEIPAEWLIKFISGGVDLISI